MAEVNRYIKDEKVAVAYSPGYGAGWATWANQDVMETLLFHPDIIQMILDDRAEEMNNDWLIEHFGETFKNVYCGGNDQLEVEWLPIGTLFRVHEYDGSESIVILDDDIYFKA